MITQCCVCKKVRNMRGNYVRLRPLPGMLISHGYCGDCYLSEKAKLGLEDAA